MIGIRAAARRRFRIVTEFPAHMFLETEIFGRPADTRYDDIESGRVKTIPGDLAYAQLPVTWPMRN